MGVGEGEVLKMGEGEVIGMAEMGCFAWCCRIVGREEKEEEAAIKCSSRCDAWRKVRSSVVVVWITAVV